MRRALACLVVLLAAACGPAGGEPEQKGPMGPPEVGFVVARETSVALETRLNGRVAALREAEVRPQVAGIIRDQLFTEGSFVRAGQTLYRIDPSLYRAAAAEAAANLASARATEEAARVRAGRLRPLAEMEAVAAQDFTDAQAQSRQAAAQVEQTRAQLDTAQINLRFTNVTAPISGRIGRSLVTAGSLATASQAEPLAVIRQLDPIQVDIQQSSAELLALRRSLARDGIAPASAEVRLELEDGSLYDAAGRVQFAEAVVDESTGTVTLRARFPNRSGILLPGMFVQAVFAQAVDTRAILVPQPAVTRDPKGRASVLVIDRQGRAQRREIEAVRTQGQDWVVTGGLSAGDRIITEGTGKARPGQPVRAVPAGTPSRQAGNAAGPSRSGSAGGTR